MNEFESIRKNNLPVVSAEIAQSIGGDIDESELPDLADYSRKVHDRFVQEQPELSEIVIEFARNSSTQHECDRVAAIALMMYEMLSAQAEADAMNQRFGLLDEDGPDNK